MIYNSIEPQTSALRHVTSQLQTVTMAIKIAKTRKLKAELVHKGDFGFVAADG